MYPYLTNNGVSCNVWSTQSKEEEKIGGLKGRNSTASAVDYQTSIKPISHKLHDNHGKLMTGLCLVALKVRMEQEKIGHGFKDTRKRKTSRAQETDPERR